MSLKSTLFSGNLLLNQIADTGSPLLREGNKGDEVTLIQEALIQLGFDLSPYGADGDFGGVTKEAIKSFQFTFKPTHEVHKAYSLGGVDGIVGQGTILGLDEALMDSWCLVLPKFTLSPEGTELLQEIEELRLMPYDDQNGNTITEWVSGATIGYGYLIPQNEWELYENGITEEEADALFKKTLKPFEDNVNNQLLCNATQCEFDAMVLLSYNIGQGNFNSSSVLKLVNGGTAPAYNDDLDSAWLAWNKSQGQVMQGLINRRECELDVYHKAIYKKW